MKTIEIIKVLDPEALSKILQREFQIEYWMAEYIIKHLPYRMGWMVDSYVDYLAPQLEITAQTAVIILQ